jgi:hypothetical protein
MPPVHPSAIPTRPTLNNWKMKNDTVVGVICGSKEVEDGTLHTTSRVVRKMGNRVKTEDGSIYVLGRNCDDMLLHEGETCPQTCDDLYRYEQRNFVKSPQRCDGSCRSELDSVVEAAKKAQLHETIKELPKQYETLIDQQKKGYKNADGVYVLSHHEKHCLSLARAILRGDVKLDHYLNREYMKGMRGTGAIDEVMKSLKEKCDASSHSKCGGHALCRSHAYGLGVPISY